MASSIINYIVEKFLANFLEINPEETKASLWSGTFEMNNVKIKEEIFQTLNLPYLQLLHGYVGKLTITLALPRFYLYPIKIELDKVFFHAKQKNLDKLNSKEEFISIEAFKDSQLLNIEELQAEVNKFNNEAPGMVAQIINNLQITINDICIRFDDNISHPMIPYSFGMFIKQLLLHTTNASYDDDLSKYTSNIEYGETNYKLIKMSNMNIYLDTFDNSTQCDYHHYINKEALQKVDNNASLVKYLGKTKDFYAYCISEVNYNINDISTHEYMLYQLTMALKITMNENLSNGKPKMNISCELNKVQTSSSFEQIAVVIKLLQYTQLNSLYRIGVSKKFYKKELNDEDKIKYMTIYIRYYTWKYQKNNLVEADKERILLKQYESGLTYDQIQSMRQACLIKINYLKSLDNIDAEIQKKEAANKGSSWNPMNYWSSGPTEEEKKQLELLINQKERLKKDEVDFDKKMKEHLLEHNNKAEEVDQLQGLKSDFILYDFKLTMPKCRMTIYEKRNIPCIDIIHEGLNVKCFIMKQGQFFSLVIDTLNITQSKLLKTPYTTLMKTIDSNSVIIKEDSQNRAYPYSAFYIEFENNPKLIKSNYRLMFRNDKQLGITLNLYTIQFVINKLVDCLMSNSINVSDLGQYAQKEVAHYIEAGTISEQLSGNTQHFNIDLDIFIKGPTMILPQNILMENNRKCLLIESGNLSITSCLPPRQDFANNDYVTLDNRTMMFDLYMVKGENFFLGTIDNFNGDFSALKRSAQENLEKLEIIDNVKLKIDVEALIEQKNQLYENMNLGIDLETIEFTLRDTQLIFGIELLRGNNLINKRIGIEIQKEKEKNILKGKSKIIQQKLNEDEPIIPIVKAKKSVEVDEDGFEEAIDQEIILPSSASHNNSSNEPLIIPEQSKPKAEIKDKTSIKIHYQITFLTLNIMKSLTSKELKSLQSNSKSNTIFYTQKYKKYISFAMKEFAFNLLMSTKGNINFEANINHYSLKDHVIYHPYHREMINITYQQLKSLSVIKSDNNSSIIADNKSSMLDTQSMISNIELQMIEKADMKQSIIEQKKIIFINFIYNFDTIKQVSTIILAVNNLQLCILLPSLLELWLFYNHYYNTYSYMCASTIILLDNEDDIKEMTIEEFQQFQKVNKNESHEEKDDSNNPKINHNWMSAVKHSNRGNYLKKKSHRSGTFMNVMQKFAAETKKHIISHTKINIKFTNLQMLFPLSQKSKEVVEYNYCMSSNIYMYSEYDMIIDEMKNKTLRIDYTKKTMNMNVKLYQLELDIKHCSIDDNDDNNMKKSSCNKEARRLLTNYRMEITLNTFLIPLQEKNVTSIILHMEPLSLLLGFKEVNILKAYGLSMSQFSVDMFKKKYNDPLETFISFKVSKSRTKNTIAPIGHLSNIDMTNNNKKEEKENDEYDIKQAKFLKKQISSKINHQAKKIIKLTEYNTTFFNAVIDVNIEIDKVNLKVFDNQHIGGVGRNKARSQNILINNQEFHEVPLLNIEINQISIHYLTNSLPYDIDNMSLALMEMIARAEIPIEKYNIYSLYQFTIFNMLSEVKVFNSNISEWEPLIEPYAVTIKLSQVDPLMPYSLNIMSKDMLNMNISTTSLNVMNTIMKRLNTEVNDSIIINDYRDDPTVVRFINKVGIDAKIFFSSEPNTHNFILKGIDGSKTEPDIREFKQSEMEIINKTLKTKEAKMLKESKITVSINGYCDIDSIDYSYNQFVAYRINPAGVNAGAGESVNNSMNNIVDRHIDIGIRVKDSGLIRTIIFNSIISIVNMTKFDLMLYAVNKNDYKEKYEGNIGKINSDLLQQGVMFKRYKRTYIPIQWIIDHYNTVIFANIIGSQKKVMLYEDLGWLEMIAFEDSFEKKNNYEDDYSKKIQFSYHDKNKDTDKNDGKENNIMLNFDIIVIQGKDNDINVDNNGNPIEQFDNNRYSNSNSQNKDKKQNINNKLENFVKTNTFSIRIKPPVTFTNNSPFPLTFIQSNNNNHNTTTSIMNPLDSHQHYDDLTIDSNSFAISFEINGKTFKSISPITSLTTLSNNQLEKIVNVPLIDINNDKNCLVLNIKVIRNTIAAEDNEKANKDFNMNIVNFFTKSLKIIFYFDYIIVNKTEMDISIAEDDKLQSSIIIEREMIRPFSCRNNSKLVMKTIESNWTEKFSPSALGLTGVRSFIEKTTSDDWIVKDVAITIASSTTFTMSTVLTIEPRFIIENCLGIDVMYCQSNTTGFDYETLKLNKDDMKPMHYSLKDKKNNKKFKPQFEIIFKGEHSTSFKLSSIDEFDIKIPYKEENNDDIYIPERCIFELNKKSYMMLRVTIYTKDNGLIYVLLSFPEFPFYCIKNKTAEDIIVYQPLKSKMKIKVKNKSRMIKEDSNELDENSRYLLSKDMIIPFIFDNFDENDRTITLQFPNNNNLTKEISIANLDQIKFPSKLPEYILTVDTENNHYTRVLTIATNTNIETKKEIIQVMTGNKKYNLVKTFISLKGIGLSIFNKKQCELLYISLYGIDIKQICNVSRRKNNTEILTNLIIYLKNFQIDYCLNDSFVNILVPKEQLIPSNEEKRLADDYDDVVPLIQMLITKNTMVNNLKKYDAPIMKYSQIDFLMQEMNLNIEQKAILNILEAYYDLINEMDYYFPKKLSNKNMIILDEEQKIKPLKDLDGALDISIKSARDILTEGNTNMMINYFMLSSIKINMTVRINLNEYIQFLPKALVKLIAGLGNSMGRITDFPLRFSEIMIENVFASSSKMSTLLYKHYERQAMLEICKLLGSSDLIGNPVGFVNKIGTGFIEFYNEPRKGFVKGPLHFTRGLAKGFSSLIGNIVGGSFQVVGNITGSLLTIAKELQGEKVSLIENNEPEDIIDGLYEGLKGGAMELINGITGIFLHPYKKAKEEGIVGFFKGLGIGLMNSVISPFAAVFHFGNAAFMGMKNTTNILKRNKIKTTRFRQPRDTIKAKALEVYNENYAEVRALLRLKKPQYSNEKLIYYKDFYISDFKYEKEVSTIILTDQHFLIIHANENIVIDIENKTIVKTELYNLKDSYSLLITFGPENKVEYFYTDNEVLCREVYSLLELVRKK